MSKAVKEFNTDQFFQKLCGTPVTISLAEILGSSPMIAKKMQDYMWITQNVNSVGQTNSLGRTMIFDPHDAQLISLQMTFNNDKMVTTFIDCSSELDLINKQVCIKSQIPINQSFLKEPDHSQSFWRKMFLLNGTIDVKKQWMISKIPSQNPQLSSQSTTNLDDLLSFQLTHPTLLLAISFHTLTYMVKDAQFYMNQSQSMIENHDTVNPS